MSAAMLEAARHYHRAGLALVAVHVVRGGTCSCGGRCGKSVGKHPRELAWQTVRYTENELPQLADGNVGAILGPASGELVDVDLDCPEAITLAPAVLPPTLTFGRRSAPRAHPLYRAAGALLRQFRATDKSMLVELRAHPEDGQGAQTVLPPSVHGPTGEPIEWDVDDGRDANELPEATLELDAAELTDRVTRLAVGCQVARVAGLDAGREAIVKGTLPTLPAPVLARIREWLGLSEPRASAAPSVASADVEARAAAYLAKVPPAIEGSGGHYHTFITCQHVTLGFKLDDAAAFRVLQAWNQRCEPPWSDKALRRMISESRARGQTVAWGAHLVEGRR